MGERWPAFAAVSASSFPWWPLWAETYVKEMGKGRIFDREYILWMVESVQVCAGPWFSEVHEGGMVIKVEVSCRERDLS